MSTFLSLPPGQSVGFRACAGHVPNSCCIEYVVEVFAGDLLYGVSGRVIEGIYSVGIEARAPCYVF